MTLLVVGHLEVNCLFKVVREIVTEGDLWVHMLDELEGCHFHQGFRLIVPHVDFVLEHVFHELDVLELQVG